MAEPLIIYDKNTPQDGFSNNGIAILCPSSCQVTKELQGGWSATLEHSIDPDGIWKTLQIFRYVKIYGQIFTIMNTETSYEGNTGRVTAYLEHITYKMNDWWIYPKIMIDGQWVDTVLSGGNGWEHMLDIARQSEKGEYENSVNYNFELYSDIQFDTPISEKLTDGKTTYQAMMDFATKYDGEIFRDNFRFSICKPVANARENAFEIRVGVNMTGIKRKVDVSTFCTHFTGYDNFGDLFAVSYAGWIPVANHITRSKNFNYDDESRAAEYLARDCQAYFDSNLAPDIEYTINLREIKRNPDYAGLPENYRYEVGDTGFVYDTRFGGKIALRITGIKYDGITGEVTSVQFKNVKSFVYEDSYPTIPEIPDIHGNGYTQVDYIEATGTQGINTGYHATSGSVTLEVDIEFTEVRTGDNTIFGTWDDNNGNAPHFWVTLLQDLNHSIALTNRGTSGNYFVYRNIYGEQAQTGKRYKITAVISSSGGSLTVNGATTTDIAWGAGTPVIGLLQNGTVGGWNTSAKLYGAKIYDSNTLVRDFVPVIRNADGVAGLHDIVHDAFYTNAGTGDFITP